MLCWNNIISAFLISWFAIHQRHMYSRHTQARMRKHMRKHRLARRTHSLPDWLPFRWVSPSLCDAVCLFVVAVVVNVVLYCFWWRWFLIKESESPLNAYLKALWCSCILLLLFLTKRYVLWRFYTSMFNILSRCLEIAIQWEVYINIRE